VKSQCGVGFALTRFGEGQGCVSPVYHEPLLRFQPIAGPGRNVVCLRDEGRVIRGFGTTRCEISLDVRLGLQIGGRVPGREVLFFLFSYSASLPHFTATQPRSEIGRTPLGAARGTNDPVTSPLFVPL
jgi:hypothetical protein